MKSSVLVTACIVLLSATVSECASGLDVASLISQDTFSCLVTNYSYSFAIVRAYHSYGAVDTNAPPTLLNAKNAGIKYRDVYHFPCYGKAATGELSAKQQVSDMVDYLAEAGAEYGMVWFDIEENPSTGCSWETSSTKFYLNCEFLEDLMTAGYSLNLSMGVYSSKYEWGVIMGSCTSANTLPLWYASWNNVKNFNDFVAFGGWTSPAMKQYGNTNGVCKLSEDADWYPDS
ncbi:glycosyl hydrolase family 25 protein [Pelomyxa schiedti]|nr:glycosyl hydrolase family 25 protein [Pelomyxa schiedti]